MNPDFMESLLREINVGIEKFGGRLSEVIEINKFRNKINELSKERNTKLIELGSLTFRKTESLEEVDEGEIKQIVEAIKAINEQIKEKKKDLERMIEEAEEKDKCKTDRQTNETCPTDKCPNCKSKIGSNDKFCSQCGQTLKC